MSKIEDALDGAQVIDDIIANWINADDMTVTIGISGEGIYATVAVYGFEPRYISASGWLEFLDKIENIRAKAKA